MLLRPEASCLLVVDVQERLLPAMHDPEAVLRHCRILMQAARALDIPVLVTEQYPKGLGPTVSELASLAPQGAVIAKLHFSSPAAPDFRRRFDSLGRSQAVIAGLEAHVCVLQTALGLKDAGRDPFVVADATSSRTTANRDRAIARLAANGVEVVTTEMVVFEWLGQAGTDRFRELSRLVR
jgi:nicotinamidase-related amidase